MWIVENGGKYKFREYYIDQLTGKRKIVSVTLDKKTKKLARELLAAKIDAANRRTDYSGMTFGELTDKYLAFRKENLKSSTAKKTESLIKVFNSMVGEDTLVTKLTSTYIREVLEKSTKNNGTRNERLIRLKALLRWGYEQEYIDDITYLSRLKPYPDNRKKEKLQEKFLEQEEVDKLITHMERNRCRHWVNLSKFLLLSGARVGEALALTYSDITGDYISIDKTLSLITGEILDTPKTDASNREIYMQQELKNVVKDIRIDNKLSRLPGVYLFGSSSGGVANYSCYRKWLARQAQASIGRKITPHIFRHTHCSLLIANGESLDAVARRLGHVDSEITRDIYLHYTEKIKENDRKRMDLIKIIG